MKPPIINYLDEEKPLTFPCIGILKTDPNFKVLFTKSSGIYTCYGTVLSDSNGLDIGDNSSYYSLDLFTIENRPCTVTFEVKGQ